MPEAEIAKAVRLLDLMFEFFAYHGCWQNGGHCLVAALLHLSRKRSGGLLRWRVIERRRHQPLFKP
jgi:hypothetical protein